MITLICGLCALYGTALGVAYLREERRKRQWDTHVATTPGLEVDTTDMAAFEADLAGGER